MIGVSVSNLKSIRTLPQKSLKSAQSFEERLMVAKAHIKNIGVVLALYSSVIRAITSAPEIIKSKEGDKLAAFAVAVALLPIRVSPTLTKSLYAAAAELYPQEYSRLLREEKLSVKSVLKMFAPSEISGVLGITYFFKLLSKCCEADELDKIKPLLAVQLRLGAMIGSQQGTQFGRGGGIAANGLRILALAVFIKSNLKSFRKYRRLIEQTGRLSHPRFELENFGCTHMDVASVLAGELGFGPSAREAFIALQTNQKESSNADGIFWRHTLKETASLWLETHLSKGASASKLSSSDLTDGFQWLWVDNNSDEILPDGEAGDILSLMNESEDLDDLEINDENNGQAAEISALNKAAILTKQHNT